MSEQITHNAVAEQSHRGDPCIYCSTPHDEVQIGPCPALKKIWVVSANTDTTEGRGWMKPVYWCEIEATAIRLARGISTQGSDGDVMAWVAHRRDDGHLGPYWTAPVLFTGPSPEDTKEQICIERVRAARERAVSLGLTDDEIHALGFGGVPND